MEAPPYLLQDLEAEQPTRFGLLPVASPLHDSEARWELQALWTDALTPLGATGWTGEDLGKPEPLVLLVLTGGTEQEILYLLEKRRTVAVPEPVLLIAHPGQNSLPAAMEVLARLQQTGQKGRILFLEGPEDPKGQAELQDALEDQATARYLQSCRIGLIGAPSSWLVASSPEAETVRRIWGPKVVPFPMTELFSRMEQVSAEESRFLLEGLTAYADDLGDAEESSFEDSGKIYLALRQLGRSQGLSALTLRCFDLIQLRSATGCFALAQLCDDGLLAGCEGDLVSLLGMLWSARLLRKLPWMANPVRVRPEGGSLLLAHCSVPRRLVRAYSLRTHFESGIGLAICGFLEPGPVTLLRIGGAELEQLWLAQGTAEPVEPEADLCRTQVRINLEPHRVEELLQAPLGNHLVMVRGHHAERLSGWWKMVI